MINGFIQGARSETAGAVGALLLVVIVLFLFKSIEDAFNDIWGVRRGRTLVMRVAFYWTVMTLGGVVFFAAVALLGAGAFVNVFVERLPFGAEIARLLRWSLPSFSFALLVAVLAVFYRAIPHTRVRWGAALAGALAVALLGGYAIGAFWLHALTIGVLATMITAVMTRASLGHTGRALVVHPLTTVGYVMLTAAALVRVFGLTALRLSYPQVVVLAASFWTTSFAFFVGVYAPILWGPRADGKPG